MADNYLDKKQEEHNARKGSVTHTRKQTTLHTLLTRNRSCRGYDATTSCGA